MNPSEGKTHAPTQPLLERGEPSLDCGTHEPIYDCWNTIGVSGNGTCRELTRYTHCRNCPVHAAAAAQFLDRPMTPEQQREWTGHYAREKKHTTPARTSVVIFRLGPEWLALPAPAFQEVAEHRAIHTLPHRRHTVVLGLVNIRGELLICASLQRLLGLGTGDHPAPAQPLLQKAGDTPSPTLAASRSAFSTAKARVGRLLVTRWDGQRIVIPVDEVHGLQRVPHDELRAPPATLGKSGVLKYIFTLLQKTGDTLGPALAASSSAASSSSTLAPGPVGASSLLRQGLGGRTVGLLDADALYAALNRKLSGNDER